MSRTSTPSKPLRSRPAVQVPRSPHTRLPQRRMGAVPDSAQALLASAIEVRDRRTVVEIDLLLAACSWADLNPAESLEAAAQWRVDGRETGVLIAGAGTPMIAEFCVAELAAVLCLPTAQGESLMADALDLRHRLPRTWARVLAGEVTAWRGRKIAHDTRSLPVGAAKWVDGQLAPFAHRCSWAQLERLVAAARVRSDHEAAEEIERTGYDRRFVGFSFAAGPFDATAEVRGILDVADALDLNARLSTEAELMREAGAAEEHEVLRAVALGQLARGDSVLPFTAEAGCEGGDAVAPSAQSGAQSHAQSSAQSGVQSHAQSGAWRRGVRRTVVLHVNLSEAALSGLGAVGQAATGIDGAAVAELESPARLVGLAAVRNWCSQAAQVTLAPVIDLAEQIRVTGHDPSDRLREQVIARDRTCVFPYCSRSARACDLDHIQPWEDGGPTTSDNLAPLCRRHHRVKTHGQWRYRRRPEGPTLSSADPVTSIYDTTSPAYEWTGPHDHQWLVDRGGTTRISPQHRDGPGAG